MCVGATGLIGIMLDNYFEQRLAGFLPKARRKQPAKAFVTVPLYEKTGVEDYAPQHAQCCMLTYYCGLSL